MNNTYKLNSKNDCILTAQERYKAMQCDIQGEETVNWNPLIQRIIFLWLNDDNRSNSEELKKNLQCLDDFLTYREKPPKEIIEKLCGSGILVDIFKSMKSDGYRETVLNIICQILSLDPDAITHFIGFDLSEAMNVFLLSQSTTQKMKVSAPYYVIKYFHNIVKFKENPAPFFFENNSIGSTNFQLICQILDVVLNFNGGEMIFFERTLRKTETKIYSIFSYLAKWLGPFEVTNIIFQIFIRSFELQREFVYEKMCKCLHMMWNMNSNLKDFFKNSSISIHLIQIVNSGSPMDAQYDSLCLLSELLKEIPSISATILYDSVITIADQAFGHMIETNLYEKTTTAAIHLINCKLTIDQIIPQDLAITPLLCICDAILEDLQFDAKNEAACLIFIIINLTGLYYFNQPHLIKIIERAFDASQSCEAFLVEKALISTEKLFYLCEANDDLSQQLCPMLSAFIETIRETPGDFSEQIDHIFYKYMYKNGNC